MKTKMMSLSEVTSLIGTGRPLMVAADHTLLNQLPKGNWIGGSIPYFMTEHGGMKSLELLQVTVLPSTVTSVDIRRYSSEDLQRIPTDYLDEGMSFIIIPAFSASHTRFAKECSSWPGVFDRPLVGWISGSDLDAAHAPAPIAVDGATGTPTSTDAVVMHAKLAPGYIAKANIINLFEPGSTDVITFDETSFEVGTCCVNGVPKRLSDYIFENKIDTKLPLIADYVGAAINVGIRSVNATDATVQFYAPVFAGVEYRIAKPVLDYETEFNRRLPTNSTEDDSTVFACNCVLNYLYARLEGKRTGQFFGPATFGEIAYMLLNQTLVYVELEKRK